MQNDLITKVHIIYRLKWSILSILGWINYIIKINMTSFFLLKNYIYLFVCECAWEVTEQLVGMGSSLMGVGSFFSTMWVWGLNLGH